MRLSPDATFARGHARLLERLHRRAEAERWQVTSERLAGALQHSAERRFCGGGRGGGSASLEAVPMGDVVEYLESLHVADLALACACVDGNESAWEHFVLRFRPDLYAAARATGAEAAREIADALYADLFGTEIRDGRRRSLLEYFHGRSKLSTWLRTVLAQRFVDFVRASRRTESLDDDENGTSGEAASPARREESEPPDPSRIRYLALFSRTLQSALTNLEARDRLRLSCYYVQGLTLAQIGRMSGEHEATVSRKLERTRRQLRAEVDRRLERECGLSRDQIGLCYEYAMQDWQFDLTRALSSPE